MLAVYKDGLRAALGLGRGGKAKILPWFFIARVDHRPRHWRSSPAPPSGSAGPAQRDLDLPSHADYYAIASIVLFVFAALSAPELLCPDRRNGTINLYLVRPLTATDYVIARWAALTSVMVLVAWLPQLILFAGLAVRCARPGIVPGGHWSDIPRS